MLKEFNFINLRILMINLNLSIFYINLDNFSHTPQP